MFRKVRRWIGGWRRDYEGWWVRARRSGDSEDILHHLKIKGFLEEGCICISDGDECLLVDDLCEQNASEFDLLEETKFSSVRLDKAAKVQNSMDMRFRSSFWRHRKRGSEYFVMGLGYYQTSHIHHTDLDQDPSMVYIGMDGVIYIRPITEFLDGRFVCIHGDPMNKYGLVGAAGFAENSSSSEGAPSASSESTTPESGKEIPEEPF